MGKLDGKVAVVTGGTSGIGEATAELFVAEGAKVVISGRSAEKGQAVADRLGENCQMVVADILNEDDIRGTLEHAVSAFGGLDILFNNAGGPTKGEVLDAKAEDIQYAMDLLFTSAVLGIKHAVPYMEARGGGSIINNASIAGHRLNQGGYLYSGAKAAVAHMTRLAGADLGQHNIRVNAISPGAVATPIFWGGSQRAQTLSDEENQRKMEKLEANLAKATPLPRAGLADDIAFAAVFLASDEGSFINSHDLVVDGGRIAMFNEKS